MAITEPNDTSPANVAPAEASGRAGTDRRSSAPTGVDRLERAILELLGRYEVLRRENTRLAEALAARDRSIEEMESRLRDGSQLQRDAAKRIDDLVGQIDQIELHFVARGA